MSKRAFVNPGTPDLTDADIPGTMFLLAHDGKVADRAIAKRVHWRGWIDLGRTVGKFFAGSLSNQVERDEDATYGFLAVDRHTERDVAAMEAADAVRAILATLTPEQREIVLARAAGKSFGAIATDRGISPVTLRRRWREARARALSVLGATPSL